MMSNDANDVPLNLWSEEDSALFLDFSEVFVPARNEQIEALLRVFPARSEESFLVVELAAGAGVLAEAILEAFPACRYLALDGSAKMRAQLTRRLERFSARVTIDHFDLADSAWRMRFPEPPRCVFSSLCVHHLSDAAKQRLFADMAAQIVPGGALLLADVLKPASPQIATLYADQYDAIVRQQSIALYGDLSGFEQFQAMRWNYFIHDYALSDTYDQPSLLSDQLTWMTQAGFSLVDCFWLRAGHAVYGGYKVVPAQ